MSNLSPNSIPSQDMGAQTPANSEVNERKAHSAPSHLKSYIFIALMVIFGPVGNTLLSAGMKKVGAITSHSPGQMLGFGERVFSSGTIWAGIACMIGFFVAYMLVLSWADYSWVLPASAVAYLSVALLGHFALGEEVSAIRWGGILVICAGVLVVGRTPPNTTKHHPKERIDH